MNLFSNYQCHSCKGKGYLKDGSNVWDCKDCSRKGIVSSAYIMCADEFASITKAEAETKDNNNNN